MQSADDTNSSTPKKEEEAGESCPREEAIHASIDVTSSTPKKEEEAGESYPGEEAIHATSDMTSSGSSSDVTSDVTSSSAELDQYDPYLQLQYKDQFDFNLIEGCSMPPFCSPQVFSKIKEFRVRDDDVWCISYPKAGTHWLWDALNMVRTQSVKHAPDNKEKYFIEFDNVYPVIDPLQKADSPRFINSHLLPRFLPEELITSRAKIIYMYRNPKDTTISYYHFMKAISIIFGAKACELNISEYIECFLNGFKHYGGYFEHMQQWSEKFHTMQDRVLILSFEEMKKDPRGTLQNLARFLGAPLSEDLCKKMVHELNIERAREGCKARNPAGDQNHLVFRKGISGEWKEHFTVAQSERMDAEAERQMAGVKLPLKLVYDTVL